MPVHEIICHTDFFLPPNNSKLGVNPLVSSTNQIYHLVASRLGALIHRCHDTRRSTRQYNTAYHFYFLIHPLRLTIHSLRVILLSVLNFISGNLCGTSEAKRHMDHFVCLSVRPSVCHALHLLGPHAFL